MTREFHIRVDYGCDISMALLCFICCHEVNVFSSKKRIYIYILIYLIIFLKMARVYQVHAPDIIIVPVTCICTCMASLRSPLPR